MHDTTHDSDAVIFGLLSTYIMDSIPVWWLSYGEKLFAGAVVAVVTGFSYKAGAWMWEIVKDKLRQKLR